MGYSENVLYPGVAEALHSLRRKGVAIGLCTSKRVDFADKILSMFGLRDLFAFIDGGDVGVQKWQQVAGLMARDRISRASVMIGDRSVDLIAAHRNGMCSAGVTWGHGSRQELLDECPQYLLDTPAELDAIDWSSSPTRPYA